MRLLALGCAALLSCTTVRTQVAYMPTDVVIEDGRAAPQIDLWIESNKRLTPAQEEAYRAQARSALEQALAGRPEPEGDRVLVVRAQGISRTAGHRSDQTAATVGLVVGAVAIVAIVVIAVIADAKDGGHHASAPAAATPRAPRLPAAPRPGVAPPRFVSPGAISASPVHVPRPVGAPPRPVTTPGPRPPFFGPRPVAPRPVPVAPYPAPYPYAHGGVEVGVGLEWWWWPVPLEAEPLPEPYAAPLANAGPGAPPPGPEAEAAPPDAAPTTPEQGPRRVAIPFDPLTLEDRGFFAGDRLELEALLLDRNTGEVLWTKRVGRDADPRDPRAVRDAMDALLQEGGWSPPER